MYPTGINKYYDMYSFDGLVNYELTLLWYELCEVVGSLFMYGMPVDLLWDLFFTDLTWDGITEIFWYYMPYGDWVVWGWQVSSDGWTLM